MGVILRRFSFISSLFLIVGGISFAQAALRLSTAAVGPLSVVAGQDGPQQTVEAYDSGGGALALTVSASETWLVPSVGAATACDEGTCYPILIDLATAAIGDGVFTGVVTVSDPNAIDAPQTITVTVQMGGSVPDAVDFYAAPNGSSDSIAFETDNELTVGTSTQSGGSWLSLTLEGTGSFQSVFPYELYATHLTGMGEAEYDGTLDVTGSGFQPDVKAVPVSFTVTSEPIAVLSSESLDVTLAEGIGSAERYLYLSNRGLGTLATGEVTVTADDGGSWLAANVVEGSTSVKVTLTPTDLAPGVYTGEVGIESNAVNGPFSVPVQLTVAEQAPPTVSYQGVVNNNIFDIGEPIAQGGIAALFGSQLSYQSYQVGSEIPLVTELGGTKVYVNGQEAPLYFVSDNELISGDQINFQIPYETASGEAVVQVVRDDQAGNQVTVEVAEAAPRLLRLGVGDYGIVVNQDGSFPMPETSGYDSHPAQRGDYLVIYAIGLGQTTPPVTTGEAAPGDPVAWITPLPIVSFGSGLFRPQATALFAGLSPGSVGLYQINVQIPSNAPSGDNVPVVLTLADGTQSNQIEIAIE